MKQEEEMDKVQGTSSKRVNWLLLVLLRRNKARCKYNARGVCAVHTCVPHCRQLSGELVAVVAAVGVGITLMRRPKGEDR